MNCQDCGTSLVGSSPQRRRCEPCKRVLVVQRVAGWRAKNPEKRRAQSASRYRRDPSRQQRLSQSWRGRNPEKVRDIREARRARERAAFVEYVDRRVVWTVFDGRCGICSEPVHLGAMHIDHIVPLSRGGLHCYGNVQPAHETCNKHKGAGVYVAKGVVPK